MPLNSATLDFTPDERADDRLTRAVLGTCGVLLAFWRRHRERMELLSMDEFDRHDIGHSRVAAELAKPFWRP
jgi:uncharacterized protein YjiS (DUF1127 family)